MDAFFKSQIARHKALHVWRRIAVSIIEHQAVDRIIDYLKLRFVAESLRRLMSSSRSRSRRPKDGQSILWTVLQGWTSCCLEKKCYRIDSSLDIPFRCNYSNNVVFYGAIHFEES